MRSRPKVQVFLSPPTVFPGQTLDVEVVLDARSSTPTDAITLTLVGYERCTTQVRRILELTAAFEPTRLEKGKQSFRGRFPVPAWATPSHRGSIFLVEYDLRVHVDIPWWPDVDRAFLVQIGQAPVEQRPTEVVFNSRSGDAKGRELYAEATLASTILAPGGVLAGAVSFGNTSGAGKRSVEISFVGVEQGGGFTQEAQRFTATIHRGLLVDGEPIPFRVTLPPSALPTNEGQLARLDWFLFVGTRSTWSHEPILRIPIQVRPVLSSGSQARVGAIGRARRAAIWSGVGAEKGWAYDEGADVMERRIGDLRASLSVEHRATGGPHVVGSIELGSLGLDLDVRPKSWIASIVGERILSGNERFDRTLAIDAREPEQARALLGGTLAEVVSLADEVRIDDARVTLAWAGAGVDPTAVRRALAIVDSSARILAERIGALPPPRRFVETIGAWRTLAARLGGRLRPGRPEIVGGEQLGRQVAVRVVWEGREGPRGLEIEARRAAPDGSDRTPGKRAEAARTALEKLGPVAIDPERVTLTLRGEACDPTTAEPHVEAVAELVTLLDDVREAGPYR